MSSLSSLFLSRFTCADHGLKRARQSSYHLCWPVCAGQGDAHCQVHHIQPWNHGNGYTPRKWKHLHHLEPGVCPAPRQDRMFPSGFPHVQALQAHPCTIVAANPVAFILKARGGFTKDLNRKASSLMNMITPATIDATYGAVPSFEKYDRVLFLAGGSGATWIIAAAIDLLSRGLPNILEVVWVVRESGKPSHPSTISTSGLSELTCRLF